jgi:beta-galactosidase
VYSRMYATTEETELIGQGHEAPLARADQDARRRLMPFLQCEYAHAMGNGPGGLADYDTLFDRHPRLIGGFIWEWIDHGIARLDENGAPFYAYGGDFGERWHDGTFIADGLLFPDRLPSPALAEVKAVFAPIRLDPQGDGSMLVRNRYSFRDSAHVSFEWSLHRGEEELAAGILSDLVLAAGESTRIRPPADLHRPAPADAPLWWSVRAVQHTTDAVGAQWMHEPFTIARGQLLLQQPAPLGEATGRARALAAAPHGGYRAAGAEFDAVGQLSRLFGHEVREFRADAWRPPTDNDLRAGMWADQPDAALWTRASLHLLRERKTGVRLTDDGALVVDARTAGPATPLGLTTRYEWRPVGDDPGAVDLVVDILPQGRWPRSVPRLGLLLALEAPHAEDSTVRWHGLGPDESYADSKLAAQGGAFQHRVADWQTRYTHPQENGVRRGVTQAAITFTDGSGLRIDAGEVLVGGRPQLGVELSLRPWADAALEQAAHPHDLQPDGRLWLHIDAAGHGLGSAACGPGVLPNAQLHVAPVRIQLRFSRMESS